MASAESKAPRAAEGTPALDIPRVLAFSHPDSEYLQYECPRCGDIHVALEAGRDTTPCLPVSLALAEWDAQTEVLVVDAGEITDAEIDAWQRRIERRWMERLSWVIETRRTYLHLSLRRTSRVRQITTRIRGVVLRRDDFRCRRCGATADSGIELVIDHVIPVAMGGADDIENLQVLCESCNAAKADQIPTPHDLRPSRTFVPLVGGR